MSRLAEATSWGRREFSYPSGSSWSPRPPRTRPQRSRFPEDPSCHDSPLNLDGPASGKRSTPSKSLSGSNLRRWRSAKAALESRISADAQISLTLDSSLVAQSFTQNGQQAGAAGTGPSLVSSNNFINFCATVSDLPITNGKQTVGGSCNPAPMGQIPSVQNLPSVRIFSPENGATIAANSSVSLSLAVSNLHTGVAVNPSENYLSAPQQLDASGNILGHYHVVIEELDSLNSTALTDSRNFVFFADVKDVEANGFVHTSVAGGLPEGYYRISATIHAANHQPVLVPISQHGSLNDAAYFTVTADGNPGTPAVKRRAHVVESMPVQRRDPPKAPRAARARDDPQSSLTLLASVIASGFENDGQDIPVAGQSSSLTSTNNYINFCGTTSLPITNGTQVRTGFCNPAPMGVLPGITNMPSSKFTYPRNGDILAPNAPMTVGLSVTKLATGNFADASTAYLSAPQQLTNGQIDGHAFIIIEQLSSPSQITPTDPLNFAFFKGLNQQAQDGVLTANVVGLPTGFYRMSSIITATNHQPALVPVMQHGLLDDVIYFTLVQGGALPTNQTGITQPADAATSSSISPASTPTGSTSTDSAPAKSGTSQTHVGMAVGAALGGIAVIALLFFALWFFVRRRRNHNARMARLMGAHSIVLSREDFIPPRTGRSSFTIGAPTPLPKGTPAACTGPDMAQLASPPTAWRAKNARAPSAPRRYSGLSDAPSYHTQIA